MESDNEPGVQCRKNENESERKDSRKYVCVRVEVHRNY